jgi:hypothetical protein
MISGTKNSKRYVGGPRTRYWKKLRRKNVVRNCRKKGKDFIHPPVKAGMHVLQHNREKLVMAHCTLKAYLNNPQKKQGCENS